jgi:protoporphyrinogen/coproporphyrinogen III oxidase
VVPKMNQGRFKEIALYEQSIDPSSRVQLAGDLAPIGGVNAALVSGKKAAARIVSQYRDASEDRAEFYD